MIANEVNIKISDDDVKKAIDKINETRDALKQFLIMSLTPKQRKALFKMGRDSIQYVDESFNYAQDADLRARGIDMEVWGNDITAFKQLEKIFNVLQPFYFDLYDMMYITGNEAMEQSQVNYRNLRFLAQENVPKAQAPFSRLQTMRWNRQGGSKEQTPGQ